MPCIFTEAIHRSFLVQEAQPNSLRQTDTSAIEPALHLIFAILHCSLTRVTLKEFNKGGLWLITKAVCIWNDSNLLATEARTRRKCPAIDVHKRSKELKSGSQKGHTCSCPSRSASDRQFRGPGSPFKMKTCFNNDIRPTDP